MRCVGVTDFSIKRISETSEHVKSVYSRADKGTIEMVYNEVQQEYTCRTGWLQSAEEKMWIQDLLVSKYIARFLSIPEQFKRMNLQAMILVADSVKMYSNDDAMWQFEFKLQVANASNAFDKVLNVTEPFTDSYIEFILDVSSITTDAIISMSHSVDYWVWLNGKEKYDSPPSIQISTTGTFVFKVNWKSQMDVNTQFYFAAFDMEASIQITKIVGFDVAALQFIGFKNINDSYLVERIKTLFALNTLVINCTSPSGMSIDDLLIACAQALPNNQLATVDLSTSAPGAVGSDMKDYLIDQGVAVYTA